MKNDYDPVKGTSPDDQPEDDAIYAWYGRSRSGSGLTCPVCFAMVSTTIEAARGHQNWHDCRGD